MDSCLQQLRLSDQPADFCGTSSNWRVCQSACARFGYPSSGWEAACGTVAVLPSTPPPAPAPPPPASEGSSSSSDMLPIIAGAAGGGALLIIVAVALFFYCRHQKGKVPPTQSSRSCHARSPLFDFGGTRPWKLHLD
eukprot:2411648-Pleurochrysis_carterae.AAC.3